MILQFSRMINHPGFSGKCSPVFVDHGNVVEFRIVAEKAAVGYDAVAQIVLDIFDGIQNGAGAFGYIFPFRGEDNTLGGADEECGI